MCCEKQRLKIQGEMHRNWAGGECGKIIPRSEEGEFRGRVVA
jgi:hypothetical protein